LSRRVPSGLIGGDPQQPLFWVTMNTSEYERPLVLLRTCEGSGVSRVLVMAQQAKPECTLTDAIPANEVRNIGSRRMAWNDSLSALSENLKSPHAYAAFRRTRNSVLSAASRCAFSSKYRRFLYPRPRRRSALMLPLTASTTPNPTGTTSTQCE
jgi:hypothetical protein